MKVQVLYNFNMVTNNKMIIVFCGTQISQLGRGQPGIQKAFFHQETNMTFYQFF
uniref:Uncharacterized protein n=1 Tax=Anguilla anguilla TaxID=7936 RepID=A0A0E9V4Q4_ANGAN